MCDSGEPLHRCENNHRGWMHSRTIEPRIKVFVGNEYAVIFDVNNINLRVLPLHIYRAFVGDDNDILAAQEPFAPPSKERGKFSVLPGRSVETKNSHMNPDQHPPLSKLTLNVSNVCNMACKYCYASGGTYYTTGILMDKNTALNAVTFAYRNFSMIGQVNFFGGEPTLNEHTIELVCEYFIYLNRKGLLPMLPQFGLTTNAYAISKRMFQMLRNYNFGVCISLDGPREIHDVLRVDRKNSGTFDVVVDNIQKIIDIGVVPEFECTYTAEHYRNRIDLPALMDFFYEKFNCSTLHCPMVMTDPNTQWFIPIGKAVETYAEGIRYSVNNLMHGIPKSISFVKRLLHSMTTKAPICHYCPAGEASVTVNADGNIYSCFMLMNGEEFCLGNVNSEQRSLRYPEGIFALLREANKSGNPSCLKCWAQPLCFGCLGEDIGRCGGNIYRSEVPGQSEVCDFKRKMIEIFLMSVAEASIQETTKNHWR